VPQLTLLTQQVLLDLDMLSHGESFFPVAPTQKFPNLPNRTLTTEHIPQTGFRSGEFGGQGNTLFRYCMWHVSNLRPRECADPGFPSRTLPRTSPSLHKLVSIPQCILMPSLPQVKGAHVHNMH